MIGLVLAVAAAGLVVLGMAGLRMVRTTGLEDVAEISGPVVRERRGLLDVLDGIGDRLLGVTMRAYGPNRLRRLEESIRRAGRPDGLTLIVYVRRQGAFTFLGVAWFAFFALFGQPVVGLVFGAVLAGWMPMWLRSVSRRRAAQIETELPDFLDVLGVTVSAGLSFRQAVERVAEVAEGPLSEEMTTALREMSLGVSRRHAFLSLRERVRSEAVASFVTALLQAEELGVPLAEALEDIAADTRRQHAEQVRQAMAKMGPKASMAMTMTIVPGAVLLIVAAMVLGNDGILSGIF
ncbi:MAG: type II secretion system F family protein [Micrococcales bacterium]|nr:type II secretion system F family protein [Micrococcales bacterium]